MDSFKSLFNQCLSLKLVIIFIGFLLPFTATKAQELDVAVLPPIISLILEGDSVEPVDCPVVTPETTVVGNQFIESQEQLDLLAGVTRIEGNLSFGARAELDFSPLDSLVEMGTEFFRESISADFSIQNKIEGFNCLKYSGEISISRNINLVSVSGFNSLVSVESLRFDDNPNLISVSGFESLKTIGNPAIISGDNVDLVIVENPSLNSIPQFESLEELISGGFVIIGTAITSLSGFNSLEFIRGFLFISENHNLLNIDGFNALTTLGSVLSITNQDALTTIDGFNALTLIGIEEALGGLSVDISDHGELQNIAGFSSLTSEGVIGDFVIGGNPNFDCSNPTPSFVPVNFSDGNLVNCAADQNLTTSNLSIVNDTAVEIPDLGSVSSAIRVSTLIDINGEELIPVAINLDITHTSVGDLTVTLSKGTTTINLVAEPTTLVSDDSLATLIANECSNDSFPGDDFLNEEIGGSGNGEFIPFPTIDADCAIEFLRNFNGEGGEVCSSNDIVVGLLDDVSLPRINTTCSADSSATAFSEPFYSPLEALSTFESSNVNDLWVLTVTDSTGGEIGTLNSWGITFDIER